jgi:hypothetical protein
VFRPPSMTVDREVEGESEYPVPALSAFLLAISSRIEQNFT